MRQSLLAINHPKSSSAQRFFSLCRYAVCALAVLSAATVVVPHGALAQAGGDTASRIKRLENDVDTLNRAVYKGQKPPPSLSSGTDDATVLLQTRLDQLEKDVRSLTGKVEQQSYDMQQIQQKFEAMSADSRIRFDALESQSRQSPPPQTSAGMTQEGAAIVAPSGNEGQAVQPPQPGSDIGDTAPEQGGLSASDRVAEPMSGAQSSMEPAPAGTTDTVQPLGGGAPDAGSGGDAVLNPADSTIQGSTAGNSAALDAAGLYEKGFAEIKKNDNAAAEKTFATFIKEYPSHALTPNAYYWLGETFYVRKDYDKASRVFAESYKKFPKGPKGADNLLKLGLSLAGKGQKKNACVALIQLKKEYPKGDASVLRRGDQEIKTLGCAA